MSKSRPLANLIEQSLRTRNLLSFLGAMASPSSSASGKGLPKVVVFDLDGCVWYPEMYHLWGSGGAPFKPLPNGNVKDRRGEEVELMADVRSIFYELKTDPKWNNTLVAAASCCDEPEWARECIQKVNELTFTCSFVNTSHFR